MAKLLNPWRDRRPDRPTDTSCILPLLVPGLHRGVSSIVAILGVAHAQG